MVDQHIHKHIHKHKIKYKHKNKQGNKKDQNIRTDTISILYTNLTANSTKKSK